MSLAKYTPAFILMLAAAPLLISAGETDLAKIPPPSEPYIKPLPESGSWQMIFHHPGKAPTQDPEGKPKTKSSLIERMDCYKQQNLRGDLVTRLNGEQTTYFLIGDRQFIQATNGTWVGVTFGGGYSSKNYASMDRYGLSWVGKSTYQGVEMYQPPGFAEPVPTYKYFLGSNISSAAEGLAHPDLTAYVDAKSGQPLALVEGDVTIAYSPVKPLAEKISVPVDAMNAMREYQRLSARMNYYESRGRQE